MTKKKTEKVVEQASEIKNEPVQPQPAEELQPDKGSTQPDDNEEKPVDNRIAVVIPYVSKYAQGDELKLALASFQKYFEEFFKIVIIGDREDWFSDEIIHVPHECCSENPQIDVLEKLKFAIASDEVPEKFVWSNDDIYLVSPVMLADLEVIKSKGVLNPAAYAGTYRENVERTIHLLDEIKFPLEKRDYATHTPVVYHKDRLVYVFEEVPDIHSGGYLISSLYFNLFYGDHVPVILDWRNDNWLLPVKSATPDPKVFAELVAKKKFLNNTPSGYSKFLEGELQKMFPEKSIFEK